MASAFANRGLHLVLANYNETPVAIETTDGYCSAAGRKEPPKNRWNMAKRSLAILRCG